MIEGNSEAKPELYYYQDIIRALGMRGDIQLFRYYVKVENLPICLSKNIQDFILVSIISIVLLQ